MRTDIPLGYRPTLFWSVAFYWLIHGKSIAEYFSCFNGKILVNYCPVVRR